MENQRGMLTGPRATAPMQATRTPFARTRCHPEHAISHQRDSSKTASSDPTVSSSEASTSSPRVHWTARRRRVASTLETNALPPLVLVSSHLLARRPTRRPIRTSARSRTLIPTRHTPHMCRASPTPAPSTLSHRNPLNRISSSSSPIPGATRKTIASATVDATRGRRKCSRSATRFSGR